MKTLQLNFLIIAMAFAMVSCNNKAKGADTKEAETTAVAKASAETFKVDASKSTIEWKGFKPTGSHNGTIAISEGFLKIKEGIIESGEFMLNMNSITVTDLESGNGKEDLEAHLKGTVEEKEDHFFNVKKYPTSKFEVTGIKTMDGKTMLSGNLTIKEATNNISIPVNTKVSGEKMKLTSETFTIDRSKWNVTYGSKSFFDDLGDKFINDDIELRVNIVANKGQ